jgi:hypothetical protein
MSYRVLVTCHHTTEGYVKIRVAGIFLIYVVQKVINPVNSIPNYNQQDATFLNLFIYTDALHVSGGSSAHHQEQTTVHTASGIVNHYCCYCG